MVYSYYKKITYSKKITINDILFEKDDVAGVLLVVVVVVVQVAVVQVVPCGGCLWLLFVFVVCLVALEILSNLAGVAGHLGNRSFRPSGVLAALRKQILRPGVDAVANVRRLHLGFKLSSLAITVVFITKI